MVLTGFLGQNYHGSAGVESGTGGTEASLERNSVKGACTKAENMEQGQEVDGTITRRECIAFLEPTHE